jgi:hypothetical protein
MVKPKKCEYCGKKKPDVQSRPVPYNADVNNDPTPHLLCDECCSERADDV